MKNRIALLGHGIFFDEIKSALVQKFKLNYKNPELVIVANYGRKITPQEIEKIPHLNVHASLLPRLKGSSPIQYAIIQGLKETGYSIILMDEKIDHGPILAQGKVAIASDDNLETLSRKIARSAALKLLDLIPLYWDNKVKARQQDHSRATWTKKISDKDRQITLEEIKKNPRLAERKIRALFPKPKAYIMLGDKRLIIHQAGTKNNRLILQKVQLEGRQPLAWAEFLRGWRAKLPAELTKFNKSQN